MVHCPPSFHHPALELSATHPCRCRPGQSFLRRMVSDSSINIQAHARHDSRTTVGSLIQETSPKQAGCADEGRPVELASRLSPLFWCVDVVLLYCYPVPQFTDCIFWSTDV